MYTQYRPVSQTNVGQCALHPNLPNLFFAKYTAYTVLTRLQDSDIPFVAIRRTATVTCYHTSCIIGHSDIVLCWSVNSIAVKIPPYSAVLIDTITNKGYSLIDIDSAVRWVKVAIHIIIKLLTWSITCQMQYKLMVYSFSNM